MTYTAIIRFLQKKILHIQRQIIFKTSHISLWWKIVLFGTFLCFISLFLPWISANWNIISSGESKIDTFVSFSSVLWRVGFFVLITLAIVNFSIFSIQKKEKLRYFSLLSVSEYICSSFWSIFIFLLSLHSFLLVGGLQLFSSNITYGKGIILCITGSIIMFLGSIAIRKEYRMNIKWSYINDAKGNTHIEAWEEQENNMKLPF